MAATAALVTAFGTAGALFLETRQPAQARIAKMTASTGMVAVALSGGVPAPTWARLLVAGLVLSWIGDLALTYRGETAFRAGLGSFLLAHLSYLAGFVERGVAPWAVAGAGLLLWGAGVRVWRFLRPHVPEQLRWPVAGYVVVISAMVATAVGAWRTLAGALAFYLSDLAVALDRFVTEGRRHRTWGLPLYYGGQLLLAWAAAAA